MNEVMKNLKKAFRVQLPSQHLGYETE